MIIIITFFSHLCTSFFFLFLPRFFFFESNPQRFCFSSFEGFILTVAFCVLICERGCVWWDIYTSRS